MIEAMKQALEALDWCDNALMEGTAIQLANRSAAAALRQAIEQAEQINHPCGDKCKHGDWCTESYCQEKCEFTNVPLPTAPAQPLTDDDIERIALAADMPCDHMPDDYCDAIGIERGSRSYGDVDYPQLLAFARAIEAHIKGALL